MTTYDIQISERARKDLSGIDKQTSSRIISKLKEYRSTSNPMRHAKALTGDAKGLFRFRIGDYRAIFEKTKDGRIIILVILRIKHRKDIYA